MINTNKRSRLQVRPNQSPFRDGVCSAGNQRQQESVGDEIEGGGTDASQIEKTRALVFFFTLCSYFSSFDGVHFKGKRKIPRVLTFSAGPLFLLTNR